MKGGLSLTGKTGQRMFVIGIMAETQGLLCGAAKPLAKLQFSSRVTRFRFAAPENCRTMARPHPPSQPL